MKIIIFNADGLSTTKANLIANLKPDLLCIYKTHTENDLPQIPGKHLAVNLPIPVYGSSVFTSEKALVTKKAILSRGLMEILEVN